MPELRYHELGDALFLDAQTPRKQTVLDLAGITDETPEPSKNRDIYSAMDFLAMTADFILGDDTGHADILVNGHMTGILTNVGTRSCMVGDYILSIWDLYQVLGDAIQVLWTWNDDIPKNSVCRAQIGPYLAKRDHADNADTREWLAKERRWPLSSFKRVDMPDGQAKHALTHNMVLSPMQDIDRECLMDYDEFMELVGSGCIMDYDGCGNAVVDGRVANGVSVYPDEEIAVASPGFIVTLSTMRRLLGDKLAVCWYNK